MGDTLEWLISQGLTIEQIENGDVPEDYDDDDVDNDDDDE